VLCQVVLYTMLCGYRPFDAGEGNIAKLFKLVKVRPYCSGTRPHRRARRRAAERASDSGMKWLSGDAKRP
jgi:hypothetical protein